MSYTHVAKFNAKQIAIFGNTETVSNTPETLTESNAIIMTGLTYDPNIASNSEALAGDGLSRDTIFSITDSFAEFSGDTYLPVLGSLATKSVGTTEMAVVTLANITNSGTIKIYDASTSAGITITVTATSTTASLLGQAIIAYFATGKVNTQYATIVEDTGNTLRNDYTVVLDDSNSQISIIFTATTNFSNVNDLAVSAVSATAPTLNIKQGNSTISFNVPVAPFLESCNLHNTILTSLGIPASIKAKLDAIGTVLVDNITTTSSAYTEIAKVKALLDRAAQISSDASITDALADINAYYSLTTNIINTLGNINSGISDIYNNFASYATVNDFSQAIATLKTDMLALKTNLNDANTIKLVPVGQVTAHEIIHVNGYNIAMAHNTAGSTETAKIIYLALKKGISAGADNTITGYTIDTGVITKGSTTYANVTGTALTTFNSFAFDTVTSSIKLTLNTGITSTVVTNCAITYDSGKASPTLYTPTLYSLTNLVNTITTTASTLNGITSQVTFKNAITSTFENARLLLKDIPTNITSSSVTTAALYIATAAESTASGLTGADQLDTVFKSLEFSNSKASNSTLTCEIRKNSYDIAQQKRIVITGARGTVDLTVKVGERPKLKLNMHGNFRASGVADNTTIFQNNLTVQKSNIAPVTQYSNIVSAIIYPITGGKGNTNIAFQSLSATNVDGFSMERTLTGAGNLWFPNPTAHDVTISILEEKALDTDLSDTASFHPEENIGKEFNFYFEQGESAGTSFAIEFTKMMLKGYKHSTQGNISTQDLTFECAGTTRIILK